MALKHVFEGAHEHVAAWGPKHWHSDVASPRSSQALCVSVWGTIATARNRTAILADVLNAADLQLDPVTKANVTCEAGAEHEFAHLLNETGANATPTCVDALVQWRGGALAVESKLTEPSFGACGQTQPRLDKATGVKLAPACSGTYGPGSDLKTGSRAPCRLRVWDGSRSPRLYWDVAWDLFRPEVLVPDGRPCPFAGPSFQLMRDLAFARALAAPRSVRSDKSRPPTVEHREWGLLVVHAERHPNASAHRAELTAFRDLLLEDVRPRVGLFSYERLIPILRNHRLGMLADDIERRLDAALT